MALSLHVLRLLQIHREVAFNKTSQALSKWDPIVLKNRQAEQLVFPLKKEQSAFAPIEHVLSGWKVSATPENCTLAGEIDVIGPGKPKPQRSLPFSSQGRERGVARLMVSHAIARISL